MEFKADTGLSQADVDGISSIFITHFRPAGYSMVERSQIDKVISEQGFQRSSLTQNEMVRIGQILNVSVIVLGDINFVLKQYNVDVRAINVESGVVIATEGATFSAGSSYRTSMQGIAQKLATKIAITPKPSVPVSQAQIASSSNARTKVEVLYGYLKIFPNELGEFSAEPSSIIKHINAQAQHGYNNWRIPTEEELSLLKANNYLGSKKYMSREYPSGVVLLVSDGDDYETISTRLEAEEKARAEAEAYERKYGVDLGLSVRWATCNLGASKPEEDGDYYAWGETKTQMEYDWDWSVYKWCNGSYNPLTKYNIVSFYGRVDNKTFLDASDDVAKSKLGGKWRMPTDAEWTELRTKCTWTWTTQNGVYGCRVTSKINGNSIFLPAAGRRNHTVLESAGSIGYYWSSSLSTDFPYRAWLVGFYSDDVGRYDFYRYNGHSVRPVSE